ncbi:MAG: BrnT family toxin [Actinobacteria bacterium]|nr:BrnT family toxin [Actinomycetota bacterium]MCL5674556.1 BrnT family toxin [Candidatus Omnitrophota bacterium]
MQIKFEWDKGNINKNYEKHKVTDNECEEIFFDAQLEVFHDKKHSTLEDRFYAIGQTVRSRTLFVVFTIRKNKTRIISARDINKKERLLYEKIKKNTQV